MSSSLNLAKRLIVPLCILALLVAAGFAMFSTDEDTRCSPRTSRAPSRSTRAATVKVLGVQVGAVDKVTPTGTDVVVEMHYDDSIDVPADAQAVIVVAVHRR